MPLRSLGPQAKHLKLLSCLGRFRGLGGFEILKEISRESTAERSGAVGVSNAGSMNLKSLEGLVRLERGSRATDSFGSAALRHLWFQLCSAHATQIVKPTSDMKRARTYRYRHLAPVLHPKSPTVPTRCPGKVLFRFRPPSLACNSLHDKLQVIRPK